MANMTIAAKSSASLISTEQDDAGDGAAGLEDFPGDEGQAQDGDEEGQPVPFDAHQHGGDEAGRAAVDGLEQARAEDAVVDDILADMDADDRRRRSCLSSGWRPGR